MKALGVSFLNIKIKIKKEKKSLQNQRFCSPTVEVESAALTPLLRLLVSNLYYTLQSEEFSIEIRAIAADSFLAVHVHEYE